MTVRVHPGRPRRARRVRIPGAHQGRQLAYTGDIRFHGRHPELQQRVRATRCAGADVLVTEGTTLSFTPPDGPPRTEDDVLADFVETSWPRPTGLVLLSTYPTRRRTGRRAHSRPPPTLGRTILWQPAVAGLLRDLGINATTWLRRARWRDWPTCTPNRARSSSSRTPTTCPGCSTCRCAPATRSSTPTANRWASSTRAGACSPTGWPTSASNCTRSAAGGTPCRTSCTSMVERIAPKVVFPVHTFEPTRLAPPIGVRRVVAAYRTSYALDGIAHFQPAPTMRACAPALPSATCRAARVRPSPGSG